MPKTVLLKPILSEKAYGLSEKGSTYVFGVPKGTNRQIIAAAVAQQFSVGVASVRISALPAKNRRSYSRKSRKFHTGRLAASRKAYVTLKEGDKLPFFTEVNEPEVKETKKMPSAKSEAEKPEAKHTKVNQKEEVSSKAKGGVSRFFRRSGER